MNGDIEFSCEDCGMEFSVPPDVIQTDEDLTCPVCQEPVSIGDSDEPEEEWEDLDEDQDDDEDPPTTGGVLTR